MYRLIQCEVEGGVETLSQNPTVWECVKDWEILAHGDRDADYRVEDEDYNDVWVSVMRKQP